MAYQTVMVVAAALLQNANAASVFGIRPNLTLIILLSLSFSIKDWKFYLLLSLLGSLLLSSTAPWDESAVLMAVLLMFAYFAKNFSPWRPFFNNLLLLIAISVILDWPAFLPPAIIANASLGTLVFLLFKQTA